MTRKQFLVALPVLALMAGIAYVSQANETAGTRMTTAGERSSACSKASKRARRCSPSTTRSGTNWNFVPLQDKDKKPIRKGLRLEEMSAPQKEAARELLRAGTSETGYKAAMTIMSLESILNVLEKSKKTAPVRNPEWYFFTVFGKPSKTGKWGWR